MKSALLGLALIVAALTHGRSMALYVLPANPTARQIFAAGIEHRNNAEVARAEFALAAFRFDEAWHQGDSIDGAREVRTPPIHTPALALNRGRAHFLAGQLPQAIRAFRDGLELFPWDAALQRDLVAARATVAYPTENDPVLRVRPNPPTALRNRVSPWDLFAAAGLFSLLVVVGLARRFTVGDRWAIPLAVVGLIGLLLVAVAAWRIDAETRYERERPVVVLAADVILRTGNGTAFPARLDTPLPHGAEVRQLAHRGGWVQVQLPGGAIGWVPESLILATTEN